MKRTFYILPILLLLTACSAETDSAGHADIQRDEEEKHLQVDEYILKKALASAAAMDAKLIEKVSGAAIPSLEEFANQPLTLVLLMSGYHGRPGDLRAYYDSAVPSQMIPDIKKGDKVSVLRESLTRLLHYKQVKGKATEEGNRIEGTVRFEIPRKWSGNFGFVAEKAGTAGKWKIIEFRLPESRRRVVLQEDENWRVIKAFPPERWEIVRDLGSAMFLFYSLQEAGSEEPGIKAFYLPVEDRYHYANVYKNGAELPKTGYPVTLVARLPRNVIVPYFFPGAEVGLFASTITAKVEFFEYRQVRNWEERDKVIYFVKKLPPLQAGTYSVAISFGDYWCNDRKSKIKPSKLEEPAFTSMTCEFVVRPELDKTRPLCGSQLPLFEAVSLATTIVRARTLDGGWPVMSLNRITSTGKFQVISVLKGNLEQVEIQVSYGCFCSSPVDERCVEKGENVILFLREGQKFEAIKIVLATDEALENVKKLLAE